MPKESEILKFVKYAGIGIIATAVLVGAAMIAFVFWALNEFA